MAKFSLEVDFDGSLSGPAYRAIIGKALDDSRQALRSSALLAGEIKVPVAHQPDPVTVGRWKIELWDNPTNPNPQPKESPPCRN